MDLRLRHFKKKFFNHLALKACQVRPHEIFYLLKLHPGFSNHKFIEPFCAELQTFIRYSFHLNFCSSNFSIEEKCFSA